MIAKPAYPYLCRDSDRHGRVRYRLRVPGRKAVTIKGQFGSADFAENYRAEVEGDAPKQLRFAGKPGTFNRLGSRLSEIALSYFSGNFERKTKARIANWHRIGTGSWVSQLASD